MDGEFRRWVLFVRLYVIGHRRVWVFRRSSRRVDCHVLLTRHCLATRSAPSNTTSNQPIAARSQQRQVLILFFYVVMQAVGTSCDAIDHLNGMLLVFLCRVLFVDCTLRPLSTQVETWRWRCILGALSPHNCSVWLTAVPFTMLLACLLACSGCRVVPSRVWQPQKCGRFFLSWRFSRAILTLFTFETRSRRFNVVAVFGFLFPAFEVSAKRKS